MKIEKVGYHRADNPIEGFRLPFSGYAEILQGYHGPSSHFAYSMNGYLKDDSYSIDFELPVGTVVLASKAGRAEAVSDYFSSYYEGTDFEKGMTYKTNFVIIDHLDGTQSLYSHIGKASRLVEREEMVSQGQPIAFTDKSGWVGPIPHLHFEVIGECKVNRASLPVIFDDYDGPLEHSEIFNE